VIVEKHFQGRDYRMVVHNGELLWTVERVPAGVTGDGRSTVAKLVDTTNADPHRGTRRNSLLRPVHLDDEALLLLERQGLSVDAVPEAGRFVRLARIANVSRGGTPVQVNDEVHPDNRVLAIDAAQALRLDLAGIDLLIPDIATSWHESGAAICEVNAGPQIGGMTAAHLGRQFIGTTVEGDGRIPVIAVIGDTPDGGFAASLASALRARGLRAGHHDATGVWLGEKLVVGKRLGALAGGEVLLTNLECDAAIISYNDDDVMINGHASDRIDWLVVAGQHLGGESGDEAAFRARFGRLVSTVAQQCTGTFAVLSDSGFARPDRIVGGEGMTMSPDTPTRDEAIERIVADVM
jgi:cyanophycin synthetase